MASITIPQQRQPVLPRPRRKTAKAAAVTISKALDGASDDSGEDEYQPPAQSGQVTPPSPKNRPRSPKRRITPGGGKKCALSPETTEYLKNWMLSPDHIDHPYPTEEEKAQIMRHCGIEMKQLTNWFVNNRKRIWKPKLEEMKKQGSAVVSSSPSIEDKDAKRRKTNNKTTSKGATSAKSPIIKESKKEHVNDPLEGRVSPSTMPPLPPLEMATTNTVTPLVDSMIIGVADDVMSAAPLLPITDVQEIMPHSCNLVDPLTNKMKPNAQPCALCSACRDWNAGEFCPWDLTGIIGDISDDTSATSATAVTATSGATLKEERSFEAETTVKGDNTTALAVDIEVLSMEYGQGESSGINSFPSTASFPVPQDDGQDSDLTDIDVQWD